MAGGIKGIIFNKIADEILDLVAGLTKDELKNLIDQNKLQRILLHCIQKFAASNIYRVEFKGYLYCEDSEAILSISDQMLDVSSTKEKIMKNIYPIIKICFVSDGGSHERIAQIITEQYVQQAKTTIQLYDILELQQEQFYSIDNNIKEVKDILLENKKKEYQLKIRKQKMLKKELSNEMASIIGDIINRYLYLLCKQSPTIDTIDMDDKYGMINSMCSKAEEVIENIDEYINKDFCKEPVIMTRVNGLDRWEEEVEYYRFVEFGFREVVLRQTEVILKYKDILDDQTYVLILELRNLLHGSVFIPLYSMGQTNIINNNNIQIDEEFFKSTLSKVGTVIVGIKKNII